MLGTLLPLLRDLPIFVVLDSLTESLATRMNAVVQAPPGAGKTTAIPLALLDQPWLAGQRLIMIEPRRLAARAAAARMAALLGEKVGATCGYRVRLDTKVSAATRVEVVTDGVFTRMIQDDPALEGIGAVLFDEFHERRLETDLGLAFSLDAQAALRPNLRLLAMSATLDAEPVAALMGGASIITATGRSFPVESRYRPPLSDRNSATEFSPQAVVDVIEEALSEPGGLLVFLPGGGEIRRVRNLLEGQLPSDTDLYPLYGDLSADEQNLALSPSPAGRRKIVLATSIAETSLTIAGIRQVIDSGLARTSRYDPKTGMSRLVTTRVSQAAAEQRAGRAGRTEPGLCWRLWSEVQHKTLVARAEPEVKTTDLIPLALELAAWGAGQANPLQLLDAPNLAALSAARRILKELDALSTDGRLTAHGKAISAVGLHPRLGHMLLRGKTAGRGVLAAAIAGILSESISGRDPDLRAHLELLANNRDQRADENLRHLRRVVRNICRQASFRFEPFSPIGAGGLLALAFPDRIAQQRGARGSFRLSGGQGAWIGERDPLAGEAFLAVADLDGQIPESRIRLAAPITLAEIEDSFEHRIETTDDIAFEPATNSVQGRRRRSLGAVILEDIALTTLPAEAVAAAMTIGIRKHVGLEALPWTASARALCHRVSFLRRIDGDAVDWPRMAIPDLIETLEEWLGPALGTKRSVKELTGLDMDTLMRDRVGWEGMRNLARRAPARLVVPTGRKVEIDYAAGDIPILAVKLQELFGLAVTPTIDDGKFPLSIHLLSPAGRPIQVTRDLPGFWRGSYKAVRSELRGLYPRHPWPEDPLAAQPTARAKPRPA